MPAADRFERLAATRVVADPAALDAVEAPEGGYVMRPAPDDLLVLPAVSRIDVADHHAIIEPEEGFSGAWFDEPEWPRLQAVCGWQFPRRRPAFAQGHIAGIPTKLFFTEGRLLVLVPTVVAHHLADRLQTGGRQV